MTIIQGDIGRPIYVPTTFDLSSNTELEIKFTSPDGTVKFTKNKTVDGVSAPAVDSPALPANTNTGFSGGVFPANTYMLYTTVGGEFSHESGLWPLCTAYTDATKYYQSDPPDGLLEVNEACD